MTGEIEGIAGSIRITREMTERSAPDLIALYTARLAGERPDCSCRPIYGVPLSRFVVGYHDLCPEHQERAGPDGFEWL